MGFLLTRKATMADMDAVMDFYYNMIEEMQGTDFDILWQHDKHPSDAHLRESVERGYMFIGIAEDGNHCHSACRQSRQSTRLRGRALEGGCAP